MQQPAVQPQKRLYLKLRWLLVLVIAAHNFEEWLTFPRFGQPNIASWPVHQVGLIIVTLVPALIVVWAATGLQRWWKDFTVLAVACTYLANVFVPHIPEAITARGYSPGVLTAVCITLPFVALLLRTAARESVLSQGRIAAAAFVGLIALAPCIFAALTLSRWLVSIFH